MFSYVLPVIAAIFDLRHIQTSDYIRPSLVVLPDPENICIAVGNSLLACIRADLRNFLSTSG